MMTSFGSGVKFKSPLWWDVVALAYSFCVLMIVERRVIGIVRRERSG